MLWGVGGRKGGRFASVGSRDDNVDGRIYILYRAPNLLVRVVGTSDLVRFFVSVGVWT